MDRFYTPTHLASTLVKHAKTGKSRPCIADFAVGGGELLRAANARWPNAKLIGVDISGRTVALLHRQHPSWSVGRCDFLRPAQRERQPILQGTKAQVDVVLLNPPFSNRGPGRQTVDFQGERLTCSLGLAFVITALSYLARNGQLLAILPAGTLRSEMDHEAWAVLSRYFRRSTLGNNCERTFPGCLAKTVIVKLEPRVSAKKLDQQRNGCSNGEAISAKAMRLERGKVDMPSLAVSHNGKTVPLVHTTELRSHRVNLMARQIEASRASLNSFAVLLPRVGRPTPDKICLHLTRKPVALSNCVLAIHCDDITQATKIYRTLLDEWRVFKKAYAGTCAQYITLNYLAQTLEKLNCPTGAKSNGNSAALCQRRYK